MIAFRSLVLLLFVSTLVSCQSIRSRKSGPSGPVPSALQSGHWQLIRKKPPTYFPKGIPADHPTDFRDGSWVYAGDKQSSRFFIPAHGTKVPQLTLIAEAQQAMTPAARKELERQGKKIQAGAFTAKTVKGVTSFVGGAASAVARAGSAIPGIPSKSKRNPIPTPPTTPPSTPASGQ